MQLAHELGRDEEEILSWPIDKFSKWVAFFKLQREDAEKATKAARSKANRHKLRNRSRNWQST